MNTTVATDTAAFFFTHAITPSETALARPQTIAALADTYLHYCTYVQQMSPHTLPTKRTHLKQFTAFCREHGKQYAEELTLNWLDFYFYNFSLTHAASTTNSAKRILKAFFHYLEQRTEVQSVSSDAIKSRNNKKPRPRYIEHDIIQRVINTTTDPHAKMLIDLLYETGLRIAEVCRLEYQDIDGLRVYVQGKGGKERTVYISEAGKERLDVYVEEYGRYAGPIFRTKTKTARLWLQRAFKRCAGRHVTPHQLRHSYANRLLRNGCDLVSIQKLLGHADISTTMIYLQLKDDVIEAQYRKARNNAHGY